MKASRRRVLAGVGIEHERSAHAPFNSACQWTGCGPYTAWYQFSHLQGVAKLVCTSVGNLHSIVIEKVPIYVHVIVMSDRHKYQRIDTYIREYDETAKSYNENVQCYRNLNNGGRDTMIGGRDTMISSSSRQMAHLRLCMGMKSHRPVAPAQLHKKQLQHSS